jgi:hypothetical protein
VRGGTRSEEQLMGLHPRGRSGVQVSRLRLGTMMFGPWGNPNHADSIPHHPPRARRRHQLRRTSEGSHAGSRGIWRWSAGPLQPADATPAVAERLAWDRQRPTLRPLGHPTLRSSTNPGVSQGAKCPTAPSAGRADAGECPRLRFTGGPTGPSVASQGPSRGLPPLPHTPWASARQQNARTKAGASTGGWAGPTRSPST